MTGPCGPLDVHVSTPAGDGPWPGVVVIHDAVGLTEDLVRQCDRLAGAGFLAAGPGPVRRTHGGAVPAPDGARPRHLGGGLALSLAPGHGFDVAGASYGQLPKDAERYLVGACPVVGSYGGRDRSLPDGAAVHDGFHGPSAADARGRIVGFFHRHLGAPGWVTCPRVQVGLEDCSPRVLTQAYEVPVGACP